MRFRFRIQFIFFIFSFFFFLFSFQDIYLGNLRHTDSGDIAYVYPNIFPSDGKQEMEENIDGLKAIGKKYSL